MNKDSNPAATPVPNTSASNTVPHDSATNNIVTTACSVPVSAAVALTTSAVNSPQVCTESEDTNSSSKSNKLEQPEAITEKSEGTSSAAAVQVDDKIEDTAKQSKDIPSENTSQINQVKESLVETESRLPLPPAGSLHSESGESGTGLRYLHIYLTIKPRSRFNINT